MLDQPHAKANGSKPQQEMISGAFLRNAWYAAAWSDELGGREARRPHAHERAGRALSQE